MPTAPEHDALRLAAGRFRKKPVVIDAWAIDFNHTPYPEWVEEAFAKDETVAGFIDWCPTGEGLYINTIEGHMQAKVGDFLIRGVAGELYACRADIFAATYEAEHALTQKGGWVSVPKQADDAQVAAGMNALFNTPGQQVWEAVIENIYADMVAARPLPPSPAAEAAAEPKDCA